MNEITNIEALRLYLQQYNNLRIIISEDLASNVIVVSEKIYDELIKIKQQTDILVNSRN